MKILLIMLMLTIAGCSNSSEEWGKVFMDGVKDCGVGATAKLTYITHTFNKGLEFSCTWTVQESKL